MTKRQSRSPRRIERMPRSVLPVIADGAMMTSPVAGGRLVPVVLVDMTMHPEVDELVRLHQHLGQGDCTSAWGIFPGGVALRLKFERHLDLEVAIAFQVPQRAGSVDQVVQMEAVFLQHGVAGDRLATTLQSPRLLIETPRTGFEDAWEPLLKKMLVRQYRAKGLQRRDARVAAGDLMVRWREFSTMRMTGD